MAPSRWLAALLILGLGVRLAVCTRDALEVAQHPFTDDSFYSLNIARNIAMGHGPTHDGRHLTNGFQPLYVLLMVPVYLVVGGERLVPIHVAAVLLSLCSVGAALLLFRLTRRAFGVRAAFLALAPVLFTTYAVSHAVNGLETSLYVFLVLGAATAYSERVRRRQPRAAAFAGAGALCGLAVWARIDGGLLVVALLADQLWLRLRSRRAAGPSADSDAAPRPAGGSGLALLFGIPAAMVLPWLVVNVWGWGGIVPESGRAVRLLSAIYAGFPPGQVPAAYYAANVIEAIDVLFRHFLTDGWFLGWLRRGTGLSKLAFYLPVSGALVAAVVAAVRQGRVTGRARQSLLARMEPVAFLVLYAGLLVAAYCCRAFGPWFFGRYLLPAAMVLALVGGGLIDRILDGVASRLRGAAWAWAGWAMYGALAVASAGVTVRTLRAVVPVSPWCTEVIPWIAAHLPPGAAVGSFQTGYLGYFTEGRRVAALDGVVNGEAQAALGAGRMVPYLQSAGVDYVVDWRWLVQDLLYQRSPADTWPAIEPVAVLPGANAGIDMVVCRVRAP